MSMLNPFQPSKPTSEVPLNRVISRVILGISFFINFSLIGFITLAHGVIKDAPGFYICVVLFLVCPFFAWHAWKYRLWAGAVLAIELPVSVWIPRLAQDYKKGAVVFTIISFVLLNLWLWATTLDHEERPPFA